MNVIFSESANFAVSNTIIIVSNDSNINFVNDTLKSILGSAYSNNIISDNNELSYRNIKSFNVILNGELKDIIIVGAGKKNLSTRASLEKLGGYIFSSIKNKNAKISIFNNVEFVGNESAAAYLVSGIILKSWKFDKYKTEKNILNIEQIEAKTAYPEINRKAYDHLNMIKEGVFTVREMVTEPANIMDPDQMLEEAKNLKKLGVKISVLDRKDMEKLGMNALLGVAKGSDNPAYLIAMEYRTDRNKDIIAIVGKGLTFDSGGLCLKPSKGMGDMKGDMTGAAVVIGTLKTLALQKAKVNVVGIIGVVENMISGKAQKPGDVVVSMSGKTIEVDNTDAEGRLVLADALWYAKTEYNPNVIVDFATLTGAIQIALGHEYAGLFSNSDELSEKLEVSSKYVGEKIWRLPLSPSYEDDIKSDIADIKNVGSGRGAGSITAAMFLKHFVTPETKWAHIDIAATEWDSKNRALSQKGATGFGVRLMDDFIAKYYSGKDGE